jgi:apolipoprotein N-acyltransferase
VKFVRGLPAGLEGWRRHLALFALGAASAAALPPLHLLPLAVLGFSALALCLEDAGWRRALFTTFAFAYGYFVAGMYWTGISFLVDAARFAWLMPLPILGLPIVLALLPALGVAALWRLPARGGASVLKLALGWSLGEQLRSHILTGLPWNLVGYVWTFSDAMIQPAAWIGIHGLSLLTVVLLAMPMVLVRATTGRRGLQKSLLGMVLLFVAFGVAGVARLQTDTGWVFGQRVRIVQAAIPQELKWRDDQRAANVARQIELSLGPSPKPITLWIWPETAVPYFLADDPGLRAELGKIPGPGGVVITGAPRLIETETGAPQYFNSALALGPGGEILATYDKRHLVPFGEYLPWRPVLAKLGLDRLAPGAGDFSAGSGPAVINLPGLGAIRPLICYEAIFPDEVSPGDATWLLSLSNDGWFGVSSGPYQHFAMTRLRAVEQGLPLVRAANTGISAVIDAHGRVLMRLGLGEAGVLDSDLPRALDAPPLYAQFGELIFWAIFAALSLLLVVAGRRRG